MDDFIQKYGGDDQTASTMDSFISKYSDQPTAIPGAVNAQTQGANLPQDQAMGLIQKYFPQDQWNNAYQVMQGESGGRPDAVGDNFPIKGEVRPSYGLFQIRTFPDRPAPDQLINPETNVAYAAKMFNEQGWQPWTAAKKIGLTQ